MSSQFNCKLKFSVPSFGYNLLLIKLIYCGVMTNYVLCSN
jgi:hypothetical protein